jgi:hypothetical protein
VARGEWQSRDPNLGRLAFYNGARHQKTVTAVSTSPDLYETIRSVYDDAFASGPSLEVGSGKEHSRAKPTLCRARLLVECPTALPGGTSASVPRSSGCHSSTQRSASCTALPFSSMFPSLTSHSTRSTGCSVREASSSCYLPGTAVQYQCDGLPVRPTQTLMLVPADNSTAAIARLTVPAV